MEVKLKSVGWCIGESNMNRAIKMSLKILRKLYFLLRRCYVKKFPIDMEEDYFKAFKPNCNFLFDTSQKNKYKEELIKLNKQDEIVENAEKICSHVFNMLGSGDKYLGERLPWNKDFKTDFVWKNRFYKNIKIVDLNNNSDVKVPWELSRFQHIFTLGKAYWLTDCERYPQEFTKEIEDWIEKNPVEMSVNWTCTMDAAIRAVNWIIGYFFFKGCESILKEFWIKFNKSLYLHGRFIFKNLENKGGVTGNHYLSDIAGLIWLGIYFGELDDSSKLWLDFGIKELEKEMFVQINKDGTNYEASTSYHRLVTEMFLLTTVLVNRNTINFSKEYMSRLEKMCEFIMDITKPNGLAPLVGDADDGRFAIASNYCSWERRDFRHILAVAGEFFNREEFRYFGKEHKEEALWFMGSVRENSAVPEKLKSKAYKAGGYYILRSDKFYCLIRCGELSFRGQGVHSHNDQLSFELNVDGEDFIIDPGVFVYSADYKMRNLFRSTEMHNTLAIQGYEQNDYEEKNLFYMKEQTFAECIEFSENKFVGRHFGYKDKCGVVHERTICIDENKIEVIDELKSEAVGSLNKSLSLISSFILSEDVEALIGEESIELMKNHSKIILLASGERKLKQSVITKGYGAVKETSKIEIYNTLRR
jgi:hypothetical protein